MRAGRLKTASTRWLVSRRQAGRAAVLLSTSPDRSVGVTGQDLNRSGIRSVHEFAAVRFELKTLGMTFEWNIGDAFARNRVTTAIAPPP
jgi:hypothetical protein